MPQFDFTTYSAQIFWFLICFFVLYYFMAKIILPRIAKIIENRKTIIDEDVSASKLLEEESDSTRSSTDKILFESNLKYKAAIDEATKKAAKHKEKSLEEFKINAENLVQKSKAEIDQMTKDFSSKSDQYISRIVTLTENKIFNL